MDNRDQFANGADDDDCDDHCNDHDDHDDRNETKCDDYNDAGDVDAGPPLVMLMVVLLLLSLPAKFLRSLQSANFRQNVKLSVFWCLFYGQYVGEFKIFSF